MITPQRNPTLDKIATRLMLAGSESRAPILAGFHAQVDIELRENEVFKSVRIYNDTFNNSLTATTTGRTVTVADIEFGVDTDTGASATLNYIEWITSYGTTRRQFYVKNLPSSQSLYVNNQESQSNAATIYIDLETAGPYASMATFSINILPYFNDEFFVQHYYTPNSWCNTLRPWGGATTAEVFIDSVQKISETDLQNIHGYFWTNPTYGYYNIRIRLRAITGSSNYIDIEGNLLLRQIPCE